MQKNKKLTSVSELSIEVQNMTEYQVQQLVNIFKIEKPIV
jgi:hypothetical protein